MTERLTYRKKGREGFTLVELMIVVIIIGILAGIAIPRFIRTAEKARGEEAITNLRLIFAGQRMYNLDNNIYSSAIENTSAGGLSPDYIEMPSSNYFSFSLEDVDPPYDAFTAIATRTGGPPGYDGRTITIDQDETWGGTWEWVP